MAARKRPSRGKPRPITDRELGRVARSLVRASGVDPLASGKAAAPVAPSELPAPGAPVATMYTDDEARERFDRRNPFGVMRETVDVFGGDQFASILAAVRTIRLSGAIAEVKDATGGKLQVIAVRRDNA